MVSSISVSESSAGALDQERLAVSWRGGQAQAVEQARKKHEASQASME
jgi:hypothetical protein